MKHIGFREIALAACVLAAPTGQAAAAGWTTFTDPGGQHAFSAQVPQGWIAQGGLAQKSDINVINWMAIASRDGSTTIFIHDPNIPAFMAPTEKTKEGSWAPNGMLGLAAVFPYKPGAQFAAEYGKKAFANSCGGLQLKGTRNEPQLAQQAQAAQQKLADETGGNLGAVQPFDAGSAVFSCQIKGKPFVAVAFATTQLIRNPFGGGIWLANVMGYRTPVADQAAADRLVRQISASIEEAPAFHQHMMGVLQQKLADIRQNAAVWSARLQQQADSENRALRQQYESSTRMLGENHDAFMAMQDQQEADRNRQFGEDMYAKAVNHQSEMMYIDNQQCIHRYGNNPGAACNVAIQN